MMSRSPKETRAAGRQLAGRVRPGDVLLLSGPLGSGKTTFVQGIAEGLGAERRPSSPSFIIMNEYAIRARKSESGTSNQAAVLRHLDLYRLSDQAVEMDRLGLAELLRDPSAITVVEWADHLPLVFLQGRAGGSPSPFAPRGRVYGVRLAHGQTSTTRDIVVLGEWHARRSQL